MMQKFIQGLVRTALVVVGLLMIAVGVWIGHGQTGIYEGFASGFKMLQEAVEDGLPVASMQKADPDLDGQLVYLQGEIELSPPSDPLTNLTLPASGLRRTVLMYQWREQSKPGSTRVGGGPEAPDYIYDLIWSESLIDSDNFQPPPLLGASEEHVNPHAMPYDNAEIAAEDLRLGAWHLAYGYAWRMAGWAAVPEEVLRAGLASDDWEVSDGHVQPRQQSWSVGAVRLRYEYLPVAAGQYSVIGMAQDGVLSDDVFGDVIGIPLIEQGDVPPETMVRIAETYAYQGELTKNWIAWIFVGLLCCLRILALPFAFLAGYTQATLGRRFAITVGASTLLTVAAVVLV